MTELQAVQLLAGVRSIGQLLLLFVVLWILFGGSGRGSDD